MSTVACSTDPFSRTLPSLRRGNGNARISNQDDELCATYRKVEWLLAPKPEPPMGAHVVTQRRGYTHHGIYAGSGKVIHYAGLARGLRRGAVEEISLSAFAAGYPVGVVSGVSSQFDRREVVGRARSRVGEHSYRLLTNNCEHFCEWCLRGQHRSYQIEKYMALRARARHITQHLITALLSLGCGTNLRSSRFVTTNPGAQ